MDLENQAVSSERDPILELRPTVRLEPLELPPREKSQTSTMWLVGWCGCLGWLVILGLVGWTVQQSLIADQRYQASIDDELVWNQKIKDLEQRLEIETQRHQTTGTQGVAIWTWVEIRETALPPLFPNVTLQGRYELTQWSPNASVDLANATWWYGDAPSLPLTQWRVLETKEGTAQVYQSVDGLWLCAVPRQHGTSTCIYPNAPLCTSFSSVSYIDTHHLVQATWIIHRSSAWCHGP